MKRLILSLLALILPTSTVSSQNVQPSMVDSLAPALETRKWSRFQSKDNQIENAIGRFGLSFQFGLHSAGNLAMMGNSSDSDSRLGFPLGIGAYCVVSRNLMTGMDVVYTPFPQLMRLWGATTNISRLELGADLRYIDSPSSKTSFYATFGLRMGRLSASRKPGTGLLGGTVGTSMKTKTEFAPAGKLGFGFIRAAGRGSALSLELTLSYLFMEGKRISADYPPAEWGYPGDPIVFGLKVTLMSSIAGKKHRPEGIN